MLIIKINDQYKIVATDDRNVTIQEKIITHKTDEDGNLIEEKISWKVIGYYRDVNQALKGLVKKEINGTGLTNFKTVCKKVEELYEYIDNVCKN